MYPEAADRLSDSWSHSPMGSLLLSCLQKNFSEQEYTQCPGKMAILGVEGLQLSAHPGIVKD